MLKKHFSLGGGKLASAAAIISLSIAALSIQPASATPLEPTITEVKEMSFVVNTTAIEGQKGNDTFITNPSDTKQYEFVRRLSAATRVKGEDISLEKRASLYWLAEVKNLKTQKLETVAIPLMFKR